MQLNIEVLVDTIVGSGIDITTDFDDWTKVAFAIASEYGEEGRHYFHKLAQLSPNYKRGENDKKYDNALRTGKKIQISTLIYIAKKYGIEVRSAYTPDIVAIDKQYIFPIQIPKETFNEADFIGMPYEWVEKASVIATQSVLYNGLRKLSFLKDNAIVSQVFNEYLVGALKDSITSVFWQIDQKHRVHNGKTIPYLENLHRDKTKGANWIHTLKKMEDYKFKQCVFGEHLLALKEYADTPMVFIVESEKTALICNLICRNNENFVWMAVGGFQNLNESTLRNVKEKFIKLFADKDADEKWKEKSKQLNNNGFNTTLVNWQCFFGETIDIGAKDDIADIITKATQTQLISLQEHIDEISCMC